ncbi:MAG TPA: hypothetical protein VFE58_03980 [Tepidisphaeraceae bacterium]|nr:hypothetical protein [Tepidisphaeraceae bacterium]
MSQQAAGSSEVDVAGLRERFEELRRKQAVAGKILGGMAVVLVGLFGAFTYFTVGKVKDNFNQGAVQKAVAEHLPAVMPLAGAQVQKATLASLPVYRDLAVQQFAKIQPELAEKAMARLDGVPDRAGKMMSEKLAEAFDGALKRVEPEVKQAFPGLTDGQKQQLLADYFQDEIAVRNKAIAGHIEGIYTNELIAARSSLDQFEVVGKGPADAKELQREFFHSLLVLVDYELMNGDAANAKSKSGLEQASARD